MNRTISMQTAMTETIKMSSSSLATPWMMPQTRRAAAWLPVPPVAQPGVTEKRPRSKAAAAASLWMPLEASRVAEKILTAGLVLAGAAGIGEGVLSMLDLVERWAIFQSFVSHLIQ